MKHISKFTLSAVIIGLLISHLAARADDEQTLAKIDDQLAQLKTYEYGRDSNPIRDMERTIFALATDSPLRDTIEQKLIDALASSNDIGRGVICRQLRVVGTDTCVPALARMLTDPELSQFARYALEGLGSDAALRAMHEAVGKTSGTLQIGLLNSLSNHKHQPMRADCVQLLSSDDPAVAAAAIRALGRLGGTESVTALTRARAKVTMQLVPDIDLALLNCAEMLLNGGDAQSAAKIYTALYKPNGPFRLAGLRGLVLAEPDKAADLLVSAIGQEDVQLAKWAIHLTVQVAGGDATGKFVELLDELPAAERVLMLKALGARGDQAAAPAIARAAGSEDTEIRLAAIEALGGLSGAEALDALLRAAVEGDEASQRAARASLVCIEGVEPRLTEIARSFDNGFDVEAIRALAARQARETTTLMSQLAKDDQRSKRAAAIDALGQLAAADNIDLLVDLAMDPKTTEDLPAIERSLGRVLMRIKAPTQRATPLLEVLPGASAKVRPVLVRQLSRSGTPEALTAVRAALQSTDSATSDAAVMALANWPNSAAGDDLIELIGSAPNPERKTLALDGYLRIASASDNPAAMFLDALQKVNSVDDKKLVLNEIGLNCASLEAIDMTQSLLDHPQLKASAAIATIRIAYKLRNSHRDTARRVLENVLAEVDHPDVQKRAQDVLNDIDKYQDHIMQWVAIGPFVDEKILSGEQSYKTVFEPEKADTSDLVWKPLTLGVGGWDINLEATYGSIDHCAAYVRTMIWSPRDQDIQVEGGSDDALRIWVNGKLVHNDYAVHGAAPRQTLAPATFRQGWNELKLKVVDHEGGWSFGCRIRKPNGTRIDGLKYEAR
jgi:HEAT repeat protein